MRRPRWTSRVAPFLGRLARPGLSLTILFVSCIPIARFVSVAFGRAAYPYDLEWVEGGTISHIQIVLAGEQIYREPSLHFAPFLYPPLYYYVSVLPTLVLGVGHLAPRLVSIASILACFVLLGHWVRDETDDPVAGVAAAGILASTYELTGSWMDLARVDSFFLLLTLTANVLARKADTPRRAAVVGAVLAAACFTKQLGIPLAGPPLLLLALRSLRLGLVAGLVWGGLVSTVLLLLHVTSAGWSSYYLFDLPSRHLIEWERLRPETSKYFLGSTFVLTLCGAAVVCGSGFSRTRRTEWLHHALFVVLASVTSFLPFLKTGGYPNGLIPAYAALSLAAGIQLGALRGKHWGSALGSAGPQLFGCLLLAYQTYVLDYDPANALPTVADRAANDRVVARMAALPKPIFVTASSHYTRIVQANPVLLHTTGLCDIMKGGGREGQKTHAMLVRIIRRHYFKTIILDRAAGFLPGDLIDLIHREYKAKGTLLTDVPGGGMWPKSGASVRPDTIWLAP